MHKATIVHATIVQAPIVHAIPVLAKGRAARSLAQARLTQWLSGLALLIAAGLSALPGPVEAGNPLLNEGSALGHPAHEQTIAWHERAWHPQALARQQFVDANESAALQHAKASQAQQRAPYRKPGAFVQLLIPQTYLVQTDETLALDVDLQLSSDNHYQIQLTSDDNLVFSGPQTATLEGRDRWTERFAVRALSEGVYYLHLLVEQRNSAGDTSFRSLALAFDSRSQALQDSDVAAAAPTPAPLRSAQKVGQHFPQVYVMYGSETIR